MLRCKRCGTYKDVTCTDGVYGLCKVCRIRCSQKLANINLCTTDVRQTASGNIAGMPVLTKCGGKNYE